MLKATITKVKIKAPHIAVSIIIKRPICETGTTSPKPTVAMVTTAQ